MDQVKKISQDKIGSIVESRGFDPDLILKDYQVTTILYLLKDIDGIYFKGGTALQKILLDYSRISEDADYTCTRELKTLRKEIEKAIKESNLFEKVTKDKDVDGFLRLVVHYKKFSGEDDTVFIDLNGRAKLSLHPETHKIKHFYTDEIPEFSIKTLAKEEMIAEKMAATIGRNKPRDHFDLYKIIQKGHPINTDLVKKKCKESGDEFSIIKMFNNAKKLKNRWDEDMLPLLSEEISFQEVMKTLARHFKLKEEKEKKKEK
jgi:predicted nucleotidyltransferase component of viral defense system